MPAGPARRRNQAQQPGRLLRSEPQRIQVNIASATLRQTVTRLHDGTGRIRIARHVVNDDAGVGTQVAVATLDQWMELMPNIDHIFNESEWNRVMQIYSINVESLTVAEEQAVMEMIYGPSGRGPEQQTSFTRGADGRLNLSPIAAAAVVTDIRVHERMRVPVRPEPMSGFEAFDPNRPIDETFAVETREMIQIYNGLEPVLVTPEEYAEIRERGRLELERMEQEMRRSVSVPPQENEHTLAALLYSSMMPEMPDPTRPRPRSRNRPIPREENENEPRSTNQETLDRAVRTSRVHAEIYGGRMENNLKLTSLEIEMLLGWIRANMGGDLAEYDNGGAPYNISKRECRAVYESLIKKLEEARQAAPTRGGRR